jgi:hypothetical protein
MTKKQAEYLAINSYYRGLDMGQRKAMKQIEDWLNKNMERYVNYNQKYNMTIVSTIRLIEDMKDDLNIKV